MRDPRNLEKIWLATITMNRLTKLKRNDGFTLNDMCFHLGNDISVIWTYIMMLISPRTTITHRDYPSNLIDFRITQRSNVINTGINGTTGSPKGRKAHGHRVNIVDIGISPYRRATGLRFLSSTSLMIPSGCEKLTNLRLINQNNPTHVNSNLIHVISDVNVLKLSYELIKSKPGNMTMGSVPSTLDGIDLKWIEETSQKIRAGQYEFTPARSKWIPKPGRTDKRPLKVANPRDKVVQKAMQLCLEAIYEPSFLEESHGFRPNKGAHTALKSLKIKFHQIIWAIEADISKCFDTIDHGQLLYVLKKRIKCDKTISLIKKSLESGYVDMGLFVETKLGTAQGSVLSPILCNIYLHEFDLFMQDLKTNFDFGDQRKKNPEFRQIQYQMEKAENNEARALLRKKLRTVKSKDPMDDSYRRMQYVRYADDFVIGIIGSITEAKDIYQKVKTFLEVRLKFVINLDKSGIKHLRKEKLFFLGTEIQAPNLDNKPVRVSKVQGKSLKVRVTPRLSLHAPIDRLIEKALDRGFLARNASGKIDGTALRRMINYDHADIVKYYNQVIRGILNYYSFADNKKSLGSIVHLLKHSCALTLALKHKDKTRAKAFKRFGPHLKDPVTGAKLDIPETFRRTQTFQINPPLGELALQKYWGNKLTRSNLGQECIICGKTPTEMHHVRKISDLKGKYKSGEIDWFTMHMSSINRKQVALCKEHHNQLHQNKISSEDREKIKKAFAKTK